MDVRGLRIALLSCAALLLGMAGAAPAQAAFGMTINDADPERVWIRFSNAGGPMSANVEGEGIPCPEQIGKTASCMTCGLCWSTTHPISFKRH